MGKAGYLPDISSKFSYFIDLGINSLKEMRYSIAGQSLIGLNHLLTEEYGVIVDSKEYDKLTQESWSFVCSHCTEDVNVVVNKGDDDERIEVKQVPSKISEKEVTIRTMYSSYLDQVLSHADTVDYWECPRCYKQNFRLQDNSWNMTNKTRQKGAILGVVWDMPIKSQGIANRRTYSSSMEKWFWNFLGELLVGMVKYRVDYISQHGQDMDDLSWMDKGDKS